MNTLIDQTKQRIGIVIPSYNDAATIGETLASVQMQHGGLENVIGVYIADDCSCDNTVAVAEQMWYLLETPLHILTNEHNLGQWANVNRAITALSDEADWILLLHADDLVKPNWLPLMAERMAYCATTVGSLCSSWDTLWTDGSVSLGEDDPQRPIDYVAGTVYAVRDTLQRGCWWHISGCAIRMATFADIGRFHPQLTYMSDWRWLLRCLQQGWAIEYIPRALMIYRQSKTSVSSVSFQLDRDIRERLLILRIYNMLLARSQIFSLHIQLMQSLVRRMVRAVLRRSPKRILLAGQTLLLVFGSLVENLMVHRTNIDRS